MSFYIDDEREINLLHPESQRIYHKLIEALPAGVYLADKSGDLLYVNHAFVEMLGFDKKEALVGGNIHDILFSALDDKEAFLKKLEKFGFVREQELKYPRRDGLESYLALTISYVRDKTERIVGFEGVVYDITEKKRLQQELLLEKSKLEQILLFGENIGTIHDFDRMVDFIVTRTARVLDVNRCSLMLLRKGQDDLLLQGAVGVERNLIRTATCKVGEPVAGLVAKSREPLLVKNIEYDRHFRRVNRPGFLTRSFMIAPIVYKGQLIGVINVADKNATSPAQAMFTELDLRILNDVAKEVAVAIQNVQTYSSLNVLSLTDPLTQIYNYRYFIRSLDREMKRAQRNKTSFCLVMIDVDGFKMYNDTLGHPAGDDLLKKLSRVFLDSSRETDIVCRYAGDEFVVILPETKLNGALTVAEKIRQRVEETPFPRKVTVSVGVAEHEGGETCEAVILKVDKALYRAKAQGRNRVAT